MTASNLPGPGRILGKLYKSLGERLDPILEDMASREDQAARAIADGISRRLGIAGDLPCYYQ